MEIITHIAGRLSEMGWTDAIDPLELTSDERVSAHFVAETKGGRHVRVSLPRGTELLDGDVLCVDQRTAVVVKARDEDLLLLRPGAEPVIWWAACYQLGNFHRPARFRDDGVLTPDDPLVVQMVRRLGVAFDRVHGPFVGRRFGAAGAHHHHTAPGADDATHEPSHAAHPH